MMNDEVHTDYPRPDFVRVPLHWHNLNGPWKLLFDDDDVGILENRQKTALPAVGEAIEPGSSELVREIQVPFVFQTPASGINERSVHEVLWYERDINDIRNRDERDDDFRLVLHFGAVDYHATVWLDGHFVGEHGGGHVPFEFDITNYWPDELPSGQAESRRLTVRVFDSATDLKQPRGKQFWGPESESIYYTPSSGIWQSVWLESVPRVRIANSSRGTILRSHNIRDGQLDVRVAILNRRLPWYTIELEARLGGVLVSSSGKQVPTQDEDFVRLNLNMRLTEQQIRQLPADFLKDNPQDDSECWQNGVALWFPEHPTLYRLIIRLYKNDEVVDEIHTTAGMRSINWTTGDGTFRLNGHPYFQALLLDQGYWPDTNMTAPSPEALKRDIELSKSMGFNGCRKHQKVEDPVFLYWADKLGFLVWGEMASCYQFSVDYIDRFDQEWKEMVQRDINHPCIVAWTPVNESWGYPDLVNNVRQRDHIRSLYYATKTLDWTRPINDNCGWEHVVTDLTTFHDYADGPGMAERCESINSIIKKGKTMFLPEIHGTDGQYDPGSIHQRGAPILCTEFGGVNIAASEDPAQKENWGYTTAKDSADLLRRVESIVMATVTPGLICGVVWTQFADIEQEKNGLYTFDRREKLPAKEVKAIMDRAREAYHANRR